ncbi:MAG: IS1595 family transposase [Candidatus Bipolaricaulis sp.]|nr:IS1595 family transposase [Candidatus Bipolaricaulis sp.]
MDKITSLVEARKQFATQEQCERHLRDMRWPDGVTCPRCGSKAVTYMESRHQWQCECRYQFSVTSATVFHKTHIDLPRWLMAVWLVCHSPKGISSAQLQRELGVTYKTAWYMTTRIRRAIKNANFGVKLDGILEADTTMVPAAQGKKKPTWGNAGHDVLGIVSRDAAAIRMEIVQQLSQREIMRVFAKHVGTVKRIFTDEAPAFYQLYTIAPHETIKHAERYALGRIHVNHVENAWSLFKRGLHGVYHFVSAKYLQDYLDEFAFRGSHRGEREAMVNLVLACC